MSAYLKLNQLQKNGKASTLGAMPIKIAHKLVPFCHIPGTMCLIPGCDWQIQVFPTLFKFKSLISGEERTWPLEIKGPVRDFTVQLNLEKLCVEISGHTQDGYRRYIVRADESGLVISSDKKQDVLLVICEIGRKSPERLSLGSHKQLDWELVARRLDLKEIFPVWLRLGQITPQTKLTQEGTASLLSECSKLGIVDHFTKLFLAGFKSCLIPRLFDDSYQGIVSSVPESQESPLILLTEGARLIRALFFQETKDLFSFLPLLSPSFHEGRFVNIQTEAGDKISFEWSKKLLVKVEILPRKTREVSLHLQKLLKSFRLKRSLKEKGKRYPSNHSFLIEEGKMIYLDRFEA